MQYYLECISGIERLHRLFLEVIKAELDALRVRDINNVQSLILYSIGGRSISISELTRRGYFLGANVSYNLKKMAEAGYLRQARSSHDRRSITVSLTEKGQDLSDLLETVFQRHHDLLAASDIDRAMLAAMSSSLKELERFWNMAQTSVPQAPEPLVGYAVTAEQAHMYFSGQKRAVEAR